LVPTGARAGCARCESYRNALDDRVWSKREKGLEMRTRSQKTLWTSVAVAAAFAICAVPASAQVGTGFVEFYGGITFIGGDIVLPCGGNIVCVPEGAEVNIADVKSDFDDDTPMFGIGLG